MRPATLHILAMAAAHRLRPWLLRFFAFSGVHPFFRKPDIDTGLSFQEKYGYLTKPATQEQIAEELHKLRYPVAEQMERP